MLFIVDDTADYRFLVEQTFRLFLPHYPLRLLSDGLELMTHVEQASGGPANAELPALIVLDYDMPQLDGLQTLTQLKQAAGWQTVPVVMMSNRTETRFAECAYQLGAVAYIAKPISIPELKSVMEQLCQQWLVA